MAKRSEDQEASRPNARRHFRKLLANHWAPILLAAVAFLAYAPSLWSDFVYDGRQEILEEGFITSPSNLPAVLSLKVLGMNLMLGDRPGQLLYLMLIAAVCGQEPFGYHLCSNLLHALNVALLFILLRRLIGKEVPGLSAKEIFRARLAALSVTLIFALHPLAVEPVAAVNYSSDLLVTFFTLSALLAATAFRPDNFRAMLRSGGTGTLCAFAAVTCKESGLATALLLAVYWFLFRRREAKTPWFFFIGAATTATAAFLAARFLLAPPSPIPVHYLGGSFFHALLIQPRLWIFMVGKLFWPAQLSADYTLENLSGLSTAAAGVILAILVSLQAWLSVQSRLGALGVAMFWLGLVTVSNFLPLYRIVADRFYYLPLAGTALQLLALLLMTVRSPRAFRLAVAPLLLATLPFLALTLARQKTFASDASLWRDTVQVSPFSSLANNNLGFILAQNGNLDAAIALYQRSLEIDPTYAMAHGNLGFALAQKGRFDEAIAHDQQALALFPRFVEARINLGDALLGKRQFDAAIAQYRQALEIDPNSAEAHNSLGDAFVQKKQPDAAISECQTALKLKPDFAEAHYNLGNAYFEKGQFDDAITHYGRALQINHNFVQVRYNLGIAFVKVGRLDDAVAEYQEILRVNPNDPTAQNDLAKVQEMARQNALLR